MMKSSNYNFKSIPEPNWYVKNWRDYYYSQLVDAQKPQYEIDRSITNAENSHIHQINKISEAFDLYKSSRRILFFHNYKMVLWFFFIVELIIEYDVPSEIQIEAEMTSRKVKRNVAKNFAEQKCYKKQICNVFDEMIKHGQHIKDYLR